MTTIVRAFAFDQMSVLCQSTSGDLPSREV